MLCMDYTEAGVLQEANQISLYSFLQGQDGMHLEVHIKLSYFLGYFVHHTREGEFMD